MPPVFARAISHIFSPIVIWPILLLFLLLRTGLSVAEQRQVFLPLLLCEFVVPLLILVFFRARGWISDLEMTKVRERRGVFVVMILCHAVSVYLLWRLTSLDLVWQLRLLAWCMELVGTVITWFWKISVHLASNSFVIAVILFLEGWQWWPLLLCLPVIAWARIVLHKHTLAQTIAGAGLTFLITGVGLRLFDLL